MPEWKERKKTAKILSERPSQVIELRIDSVTLDSCVIFPQFQLHHSQIVY